MRAKKDENGFMSIEQMNARFINVLQLAYMTSSINKDGEYVVPHSTMQMIETELDFNSLETTEKKIIDAQIKRYRKRKSYLFWFEILNSGNYNSYKEAKEVLLMIDKKSSGIHQSMTQNRYSTESMFLALDDYFGTNKLIVTPNRFLTRNIKKRKPNKKGRKCVSRKKSTKKKATKKSCDLYDQPF
tara:strand:- start:1257 stop:1814 length:558 start_codon:yes stop_codon:yes gene_type:complete